MVELSREDFGIALPLFADSTHSRSFIFALFEGNHMGRVFVDRTDRPSVALLDLVCEFSLVKGKADDAAFNAALQAYLAMKLTQDRQHLLLVPFSDDWRALLQAMLGEHQLMTISRSVFAITPERFAAHQDWRARVPPGFAVRRYDHALAASAGGIAEFWGSLDNFMAHGLGYAVLKSNEVVSRCHSVLAGDGRMEISIETSETYRRRGFAALASSAFIEHCFNHGLKPDWSCFTANAPSVALALKLGFMPQPGVQLIYVRP